jgi:hypothetical protein
MGSREIAPQALPIGGKGTDATDILTTLLTKRLVEACSPRELIAGSRELPRELLVAVLCPGAGGDELGHSAPVALLLLEQRGVALPCRAERAARLLEIPCRAGQVALDLGQRPVR